MAKEANGAERLGGGAKRLAGGAERVSGGAEMEAREGDLVYVSQMGAVEKLSSMKGELKKATEGQYNWRVSSQLTQKELAPVSAELEEKKVLIESLGEATKARERDGEGQRAEPGEAAEIHWCEICV